ncbi:hypothetical protein [Clostridium beijerinckii]|uniref:hypothetical protein n=1 Tax=Clostridium beijerinckii TaxID=1520 RepID=UPI0009C6C1CF|nr:hypothetical protein [Clostridium beijerinckii]NRT77662.1 hypothetical protein [Clostridium beijerinckii]OOM50436.1 hypothetical protein CBEIJ_04060 [Clostridium beijerinckii]
MLKIRVTFVDDRDGQVELEEAKQIFKDNYRILNESRIYKGRNKSKYSNVYLEIEKRK